MDATSYWVALHRVPGMGRVRFAALESHFGDLAAAWGAPLSELLAAGLDRRTAEAIVSSRSQTSPEEEQAKLDRLNVRALTWHDAAYPARLKEIYDVPPVLYVRGDLRPEDDLSVTVVGTRRPTSYGREVAEEFAGDLTRNGVTVVSGLAKGIDGVAHRAALAAGGRTIAVFGCGLDVFYPAENASLAREVAEHGALVSDYPLGTRPRAEFFPRRNRILSGLSLGTLVIEADEKSGALITARLALEQDREVFAVPGSLLSPPSRGANRLIQRGEAKLVTRVQDILEELNVTAVARQLEMPEVAHGLTSDQATLLRLLTRQPTHIDELYRQAGMPMPQVTSALSLLELSGFIRQVGGMHYVVTREAQEAYKVEA
ncbi:MAG: DNA-protecting protein DprA [Chloroflexi bacterium]|nr:DNA-protecting protein DprA [Chloroflexota bacterium]